VPKCDLPEHLRERLHDDWIWPLSLIPRGFNAFGHRCSGWRLAPKLLIGYNVTRWMNPGDKDIIDVRWKKGWSVGGINMKHYGPSPLQKFSKWGFSLTWPLHFEFHCQFTPPRGYTFDAEGPPYSEKVLLFRIGCRWDSLDKYYNIGPYIGLAWN